MKNTQIILIRHAETAWSLSGQHTSKTDLELTAKGVQQAQILAKKLTGISFDHVFTSPYKRAVETCSLVGLKSQAQSLDDLKEWDYGIYEGLTHDQILSQDPSWSLFHDGAPQGESPSQVQERSKKICINIKKLSGNIALFSHGHFLRVLMTQWINQPIELGSLFLLSPASISILGYERGATVVSGWNRDDLK